MNAVAGPLHTGVGSLPWAWFVKQFCRQWKCTPKEFYEQDMTTVLEHLAMDQVEAKADFGG